MNRKHPFTSEEFKAIYSKATRLCVDLVIKTDKGFILTLRKKNGYEGLWHIPGGTVFYRESIEKAAKRIAKEELGIGIIIKKFWGYLEYFSEVKGRGFGYSVSLVLICDPVGTELKLDNQTERVNFLRHLPRISFRSKKNY